MREKIRAFLFLQFVIQIILLIGEIKVLSACRTGFVNFNGTCDECGLTFQTPNVRSIDGKIVGGINAKPNSWPAQAMLYIRGSSGTSMCGGTLIKRNVVLTAAHCAVISSNGSNYKVYLGAHDLSNSTGVFITTVSRVILHSGYNPDTMQNDIAILILSRAAPLSARIQLACLPSLSTTFPSANLDSWILGWGTTSYQGSTSNLLQNAKIKVLNHTTACKAYTDNMLTNWNTQICAGVVAGGKDTCQGDSGGPLYVRGKIGLKTKYILAGVVSFGNGCAWPGWPGIYTRTSAYIRWIATNSV